MKRKFYLVLCIVIIISSFKKSSATVAGYTFASSTGNYLSITGTTLYSGAWDDNNSALITIPFSFSYNNIAYTTVSVSTNGFITLGAIPSTVYCGLQTSEFNSIAGYGTDLVGSATSTIQYTTRGAAPNRQFVVQWADCDHYNNANANHWTFQIILNETSNTVQVVWGSSTDVVTMDVNTCADAGTESGNVGLLGANASDFNIRSVTNGTNTWATSVAGSALTAVCNMSSTNIPSLGLTYTWTPGATVAMSFTSCTTSFLNNAQSVPRSSVANQILQVRVVTTGTLTPFNVSSLSLSTTGCTNAALDVSNAKIYFTGLSSTFSSSTQYGSTVTSPNGAYAVNGTATLGEGTNYFWITYDISGSANFGDVLAGCCTQIVGSGTMGTRTPTVTCPAGSQTISQVGNWNAVNAAPHSSGGGMLLLSDGTVMCKTFSGGADGYGNLWDKLTPNANGSYVNGTWSTLAAMNNTRLYFSSQVMKDGRVYVAGGEYGTGLQQAETYNPLSNTWTAAPSPGQNISDANSEILEDGRIVQALVAGTLRGTTIYNPSLNTFATGPTCLGIHNESAWVKLPDNSILFVDRLSTASERYIPSTNTWISDATVPVALYDPYGDETGGALLLPDGRAFFLGSLGHTAYYTPSGTTSPGSWSAGPDVPGGKGAPDAPMAMMVNGKIICAVSPVPTSANHFPSPTSFYEFDYLSNTFSLINAPGGTSSLSVSTYVTNFLDLPDGTVLFSRQNSNQYYVYAPTGSPVANGKPTINNITQTSCTSFSITGTLFNGISQGASYGDDWQMASNYPIVRLTSGANVYYARTSNWNSTGVRRGALADTTQFTTPAGLPAGTYSLVVIANGIASNPVTFVFNPVPTLSSTLTPPAICTNTAFTYTPASASGGAIFTWTRASVAGISNAAVTVPQSTNPNEVLINTTSSPISVIYSYTISANGCSNNTQSVTVVVNPIPTAATISAGGNTVFCSGGSVLLSGNTNSGAWSVGGGTTSNLTATISGNYFVTNSNSCGTATSNHIIVTVNPLPVVTANNVSGCLGISIALSGSPAGGTWSVANPYSGSSTTYTHTYTDANGCTNTSASATITVNPLPIVTAGNVSGCSGTLISLVGSPAGGTWSVANPYSGSSTSYTHTYTDGNGCTATSSSASITVNPLPNVSAGTYAQVCVNSSLVTLNGFPAGGSWSGTGVNGTTFNPAIGAGTYQLTYSYTDGNGCSNTATAIQKVNALPVVSSGSYAGVCDKSSNIALVGSPAGGSWSGTGVSGNTFVTANVNPGSYPVTYSYTDVNGCSNSSSTSILVNALPVVTASNVSGCAGSSIALSGSPAGGTWSVSNPYSGSSTTYTHTFTDINGCTNTSSSASITVNPLPTVSFSGLAVSYNVSAPAVTLTGSPTGGTFSGPGVSGNTFSPSTAGAGGPYNIIYSYTDGNGCSNTSTQQTTVTGCVVPNQPGTITATGGNAKVCPGDSKIYSIAVVTGATSYTWTTPTGGSIVSGQGSRTVTVNYTAGFTATGTLSVVANSSCGSSIAKTLTITRNTPSTPAVISGLASGVCAGTTGNYSVTNVAGMTYNWTAPVNASITSGQGSNTVTVNFSGSFTTGSLTVTANNGCGTSNARSLSIISKPSTPGTISGSSVAVCASTSQAYSVANVAGVTYNWTAPVNASIQSGQGSNSVVVNFSASFTSGSLTVAASNGCGVSALRSIAISSVPALPGSITGLATNLCNAVNIPYSIAAVANATGYNWTIPVAASFVSNTGTGISLNYGSLVSGQVCVTAANLCGTSAARCITVSGKPATPSTITGTATVCANQTGITYSCATQSGANYTWLLPAGCTITSGQGTGNITANWGTVSGTVRVTPSNGCGTASARTKAVTVTCRDMDGAAYMDDFYLSPNPASDHVICNYTSNVSCQITIALTDMTGRIVHQVTCHVENGSNKIDLDLSSLAKGIYLVGLTASNRNISVEKLVVE